MNEQDSTIINRHTSPPLGDGGLGDIVIYGLPYCDATKLAMEWFKVHNISFSLHDYKTQGITAGILQGWCQQKGWQLLLNKRSTTWRSLNAATQSGVTDEETAIALMVQNTSLIKRPVIVRGGNDLSVGVDKPAFEKLLL